ncbi:MAG: hypothetical protein ACI8ZN_000698 [Bacteroidia bacterium]|jgi:hypothetical protein
MEQNSTLDYFILNQYKESTPNGQQEIAEARSKDSNIDALCSDYERIISLLDQYSCSPNATSVQIIMEESMGYSELETH